MNLSQTLGISPEVIREHGLTPEEYEQIKHCWVDANQPLLSWEFSASCGASIARINLHAYI